MIKKYKSTLGHESQTIFTRRFDILLYAVRTTDPITTSVISDAVLEASTQTIRDCLNDLVDCGLLRKTSIHNFVATEFAKELMGVS